MTGATPTQQDTNWNDLARNSRQSAMTGLQLGTLDYQTQVASSLELAFLSFNHLPGDQARIRDVSRLVWSADQRLFSMISSASDTARAVLGNIPEAYKLLGDKSRTHEAHFIFKDVVSHAAEQEMQFTDVAKAYDSVLDKLYDIVDSLDADVAKSVDKAHPMAGIIAEREKHAKEYAALVESWDSKIKELRALEDKAVKAKQAEHMPEAVKAVVDGMAALSPYAGDATKSVLVTGPNAVRKGLVDGVTALFPSAGDATKAVLLPESVKAEQEAALAKKYAEGLREAQTARNAAKTSLVDAQSQLRVALREVTPYHINCLATAAGYIAKICAAVHAYVRFWASLYRMSWHLVDDENNANSARVGFITGLARSDATPEQYAAAVAGLRPGIASIYGAWWAARDMCEAFSLAAKGYFGSGADQSMYASWLSVAPGTPEMEALIKAAKDKTDRGETLVPPPSLASVPPSLITA